MFPKKGKFFPDHRCRPGTEIRVEKVIGEALRADLGGTARAVTTIMDWTGASDRTVKNWLLARGSPRGAHLICLMRHSHEVLGAVLELAGRKELFAAAELRRARNVLAGAVKRYDELTS